MLLNYIITPSANVVNNSSNTSLYVWGDNSAGQLGTGDRNTLSYLNPVAVTNFLQGNSFSQIKAGNSHVLAIDTNNRLWAWGDNNFGQLGDGTNGAVNDAYNAKLIEIGGNWYKQVSSGGSHTAAIKVADNSLWTWGLNNAGQLGDGTTIDKSSPVQVTAQGEVTVTTGSWKQISVGSYHMASIRSSDSSLWVWGQNSNGQLGDGTNGSVNDAYNAKLIEIGGNWYKQVSSGGSHTAAIKAKDNSLWIWGLNSSGQLGDGTTINKSSPVQVTAQGDITVTTGSWKQIFAGSSHVMAIRASDSSLWAWGMNTNGQLGDGTTIDKISPVKIGSSSWSKICATLNNSIAIDITGALYTWGQNNSGQLGDGTIVSKSSPVKIGSSSWSGVSVGYSAAAAIDITGALYTWGDNINGNLGDGTTINKSSPVKIGSSSWSMVDVSVAGAAAIDITGALYTWGANSDGRLGDGTTISKSSPVKIGSSSWSIVSFRGGPSSY